MIPSDWDADLTFPSQRNNPKRPCNCRRAKTTSICWEFGCPNHGDSLFNEACSAFKKHSKKDIFFCYIWNQQLSPQWDVNCCFSHGGEVIRHYKDLTFYADGHETFLTFPDKPQMTLKDLFFFLTHQFMTWTNGEVLFGVSVWQFIYFNLVVTNLSEEILSETLTLAGFIMIRQQNVPYWNGDNSSLFLWEVNKVWHGSLSWLAFGIFPCSWWGQNLRWFHWCKWMSSQLRVISRFWSSGAPCLLKCVTCVNFIRSSRPSVDEIPTVLWLGDCEASSWNPTCGYDFNQSIFRSFFFFAITNWMNWIHFFTCVHCFW